MGGGQRSPSYLPAISSGGKTNSSGKSSDAGGRNVIEEIGLEAKGVTKGSTSGETRFLVAGLEGLADFGIEEKRLVYVRSPKMAGYRRAEGSVAEQKNVGQDSTSSEELESESVMGGNDMVDSDLPMQDSSDLDEVMDILGGSEAEEFIKEVNSGSKSLDQVSVNLKDCCSGEQYDRAAISEQIGGLDFDEKTTKSTKERNEVSKILDNLIFEPDKNQFSFESLRCIGDLQMVSSGSKA